MADATRFQVKSKQIVEQKQATDAIATQMEKLTQSQAQIDELIQSHQRMEAMMAALMSQRSNQLSRPPDPPYSASGDLTSYSQAPQPPDPPDIGKSRQDLTIKAPDLPDFNQFELISTNQVPNKLTVRYSCEEIHERMTNGLCIFCEDLDTPGHYNLKHKRSKLCLVKCVDDGLPDAELVEPAVEQISNKSVDMNREEESNSENESRPEFSHQVLLSQVQHTPTNQYRAPFNPCQNHSDKPHNKSKFGNCIGHEIEFDRECEEIEDDELKDKQPEDEVFGVNVETMVMNEDKKPQIFVMECEDATISGDETDVETNSLLEKETIPSSALGDQVSTTQSQDINVIQPEKLIHDTGTIMEMGPIQEPESLKLTDSLFEVDFVPSQFQVPIPSLEPSRRRQKESLAVINDLSCDLSYIIGEIIECTCDSEIGQDNSLDEEEFEGCKLGKLSKNEGRLSIVCLLGITDMSCWTQFSSLVKAYEMSLLGRDKWKWSEKHMTYDEAWKFKYIQRVMLSVLLQNEQHKLLQGMNIKCKMRKIEVLRRIKQSPFIEVQFDMKNSERMSLELVDFQANTRDAEIETTLIDKDAFENPLEDSYKACAHDYISLGVLELIRDKASRKRKLCKNWWFKYKLNIWFSEALHFWRKRKYEKIQRVSEDMVCGLIYKTRKARHCVVHETNLPTSHVWYGWKTKGISPFLQKRYRRYGSMLGLTQELHHTGFVKIMQTFSPMIEDTHWDKETWVKLNPESCKGGSLLEFLKRHEARFDMIKVPNNTKFFKFTIEQSEKPLITILSYEWFHLPRPPELSCCKEDEESTTKFSSLRTRMF